MTESTAVNAEGRISPADLVLWNDRQQQGLARIVAFLREHGAVPGIQFAHAGRKGSVERPRRGGRSIHPDDPYWPNHAARELGVEPAWPDQYLRAV